METFFQDEYINSKVFTRLKKEIKKDELERTIAELSYINEVQGRMLSRSDFTPSGSQELEFVKKLKNARRNNI